MQCVFNDNEFLERVQDPEAKFESNIECNYIDMPNIWHFKDEKFQDFFNQLAEHEDYSLFDQTVIQKFIDFNYPYVRAYTVRRLFIPFIAF